MCLVETVIISRTELWHRVARSRSVSHRQVCPSGKVIPCFPVPRRSLTEEIPSLLIIEWAAVHSTHGVMTRALPTVYVMVARGPRLFVLDRSPEAPVDFLIDFRAGEWRNLDFTNFFVRVFFPTPTDLVSFYFRSCLHSKLSFILRLISVYVFFVRTWKAVNNLGVALLSQGKLKEVSLCPFWCVPCLWCSPHVIAAFAVGSLVCNVLPC